MSDSYNPYETILTNDDDINNEYRKGFIAGAGFASVFTILSCILNSLLLLYFLCKFLKIVG
jgi:hypothetical protein